MASIEERARAMGEGSSAVTPAPLGVPKERRGALASSSLHWTRNLSSDHATTRLGARFHLRKLFLRDGVDEFSQSELEFIVQYLMNETTIAEQPWWAALTQYERLEVVNTLELYHVPRGESQVLWFSSKETAKDCVLLYGNAEAKPMDRNVASVLLFAEGSVVGSLRLPAHAAVPQQAERTQSPPSSLPNVSVSVNATAETWRRVKREQAFRNGLHHYNKLTIHGPADYFVVTSSQILQTTSKAADRLEREQLLRLFGLERFLGAIRKKSFESGAILAKEDEKVDALYFIMEGECRASVRVDDHVEQDPFAEKKLVAASVSSALLRQSHCTSHRPTQLPIASLGPRSLVGDVSMLLGLCEPATIEAVTAVTVLSLAYEDYIKDVGDMRDPVAADPINNMKTVAVETVSFVLERVKAEAAYYNCDLSKKIQNLEKSSAEKKLDIASISRSEIKDLSTCYPSLKPANSGSNPRTTPQSILEATRVVPTVVQKYKDDLVARPGATEGRALGPVILSKRAHKLTHGLLANNDGGVTRMTREQRKAAIALNGLHSPLGLKSLGQLQNSNRHDEGEDEQEIPINGAGRVSISNDSVLSQQRDQWRHEDIPLFLVPTMTRQRQLHARSLPLLPRYRGYERESEEL